MKSLIFISLIPLCIPAVSNATWNATTTLYNLESGETYNNQALHLYNNQYADSLVLNGYSHLTINGGSLLSNSVINNRSVVHLYTINSLATDYPTIRNTQLNDQSILILETNSISSGPLFIAQGSMLNIIHVDNDSSEPFLTSPQVTGNVTIENLNLAGTALITPTATLLEDDYEDVENNYQQQPGPVIVTRIENLTMQPGSKLSLRGYIPHMQFNQLQINTLSGSGEFMLDSHLAGGLSDKMVVSGHASGHFGLTMTDSGYEPVTPERVDVISVNRGDAKFELLNNDGVVEAGVWQYTLQHEKNDEHSYWYLSNQQVQSTVAHDDSPPECLTVTPTRLLSATEIPNVDHQETLPESLAAPPTQLLPPTEPQSKTDIPPPVNQTQHSNSKPILSRSAQAVVNMASAARHILATEMSTFHQRMSDVSPDKGNLSLWVRHLKNNSHHTARHGTSFHTHLQGIQIGMDNSAEFNHGRWILGAFISDSKTTVRSGRISNGNIRSQSGALYTTWLNNSGFYWDNVFKLNRFHHEVRTEMNSGQITKGHYRQHGLSIASEIGYPLHPGKNMTLTPYGKVSYFRTDKVKHVLDNGLATTLHPASNLDGEAGLLLEVPFSIAEHRIRPYFKVAISHEFTGDNPLTINRTTLKLPDARTQGKYGLGSTVDIADNFSVYAAMDYQKGSKINSPVDVSLGLRVSF